MASYYLGMISGTSVDGVDAAICRFGEHRCEIIAASTFAYPPAIEARIQALIQSGRATLAEIGSIDIAVGRFFADAARALIESARLSPRDIAAIGHHGQTIWHQPGSLEPFTWQIGDPNSVAAITGIDTVADLRGLDMAHGGQGAPIVPPFHQWLFATAGVTRVILNVGGIANLTLLAPGREVIGFDTGPGNTLLDAWARRCLDQPFDMGGRWASSGTTIDELLRAMLDEPYFRSPTPKSTGRELFNETWLQQKLAQVSAKASDADVAATLLELTARTVADAIAGFAIDDFELVVCGGGAKNDALMQRLGDILETTPQSSAAYGLDPDWVEATAMAWLAQARIEKRAGNLPSVTAAREACILGGLYSGRSNDPD